MADCTSYNSFCICRVNVNLTLRNLAQLVWFFVDIHIYFGWCTLFPLFSKIAEKETILKVQKKFPCSPLPCLTDPRHFVHGRAAQIGSKQSIHTLPIHKHQCQISVVVDFVDIKILTLNITRFIQKGKKSVIKIKH